MQQWGGAVQKIRPGDVVQIPPWREALARRRADHGHDEVTQAQWKLALSPTLEVRRSLGVSRA